MGAGGRDYHNFLTFFKNNPNYKVVAFTAAQIPGIEKRFFPKELAGKLYSKDIPIYKEEKLAELIKELKADEVVFSYSDVSNDYVMKKASLVISCGASFKLLGPNDTILKSKKPVISVCATRTGAGKSPVCRKICKILKEFGFEVGVVRHPMLYGDLKKQIFQKFENLEDLDKYNCSIEEREEYEKHLINGFPVYAGLDYKKILKTVEREVDIIVWDGGNNDFPFFKPDFHIVVADARRAGHEIEYYPGFINLRMADLVIINKVDYASKKAIKKIEENVRKFSRAEIIHGNLQISCENPEEIKNKKVLCVEDGPTLTHGELSTGAAYLAAKKYKAKEIIDPRKFAFGEIKKVFKIYKHLKKVLPAIGYSKRQMKELEKTINKAKCDLVIIGTPTDLRKYLKINKKAVKVDYEFKEKNNKLNKILKKVCSKFNIP